MVSDAIYALVQAVYTNSPNKNANVLVGMVPITPDVVNIEIIDGDQRKAAILQRTKSQRNIEKFMIDVNRQTGSNVVVERNDKTGVPYIRGNVFEIIKGIESIAKDGALTAPQRENILQNLRNATVVSAAYARLTKAEMPRPA